MIIFPILNGLKKRDSCFPTKRENYFPTRGENYLTFAQVQKEPQDPVRGFRGGVSRVLKGKQAVLEKGYRQPQ
jgi:hypothetical protein